MKRGLQIAAALVGVQLALVGAWWAVESGREPDAAAAAVARPSDPLPAVPVRHLDGSRAVIEGASAPALVHVWASWCAPCRDELPALLAYAEGRELEVVAVSVDERWEDVRRVVGERVPPEVVLGSGALVRERLGVEVLPVTFVVDGEGVIQLRYDEALDWGDPELRAQVEAAASAP